MEQYCWQFEREFKPRCLGNWEVAKWFPERPRAHKAPTKIIVNDRGHLLPGVQRPTASPWGTYKGTWQLPNKISRQTASEITGPQVRCRRSWQKRSAHVPILPSPEPEPERENESESEKQAPPSLSLDQHTPQDELEADGNGSGYKARKAYSNHGDNDYYKDTAQDRTTAIKDNVSALKNDINNYNAHCKLNNGTDSGIKNNSDVGSSDGGAKRDRRNNVRESGFKWENDQKTSDQLRRMPPLANAYCAPQIAKNLAVENLKHHPLPDTVQDALYKSMQMKRDKYPGGSLDVRPGAAAVGCKSYGAPGPTRCSKLKVYRPKTAGPPSAVDRVMPVRPKTSGSDHRKKHLSQMQLALCWDLKPPDPSDEPERPPHVDGSNGSAAPAVFSLVRPPAPTDKNEPESEPEPSGRNRDIPPSNLKTAWEEPSRPKGANPSAVMDIVNSYDAQSAPILRERTDKDSLRPSGDYNKFSKTKQHHQSTPNLSGTSSTDKNNNNTNDNINNNNLNGYSKNKLLNNRPCMSCEMRQWPENGHKSGNRVTSPNGGSAVNSTSQTGSNNDKSNNNVRVPKPRTPYAKRSYSIGTLAPPFSLWPGTTGQDYPEHWRLASVYQHSYKPIESRRKTFLQSVYQ